jgi:hypothetical protein
MIGNALVNKWLLELRTKFETLIKSRQDMVIVGQSSLATMLLSEEILRRDWDSEEEDSAWAHL